MSEIAEKCASHMSAWSSTSCLHGFCPSTYVAVDRLASEQSALHRLFQPPSKQLKLCRQNPDEYDYINPSVG